jgi:hypothetical protein
VNIWCPLPKFQNLCNRWFKMLIYVGEIGGSAEMTVEITVKLNVTPYSVVDLRRNVGSYPPDYMVPYPRRRLLSN